MAATTMDAMGSSMVHCLPSVMAAVMPMAAAMDDSASLRWCHAFAIVACDLSLCPCARV